MNEWGAEPSLDELLADPATRLVMAGDHVKEPALRTLLVRMGKILEERRTAGDPSRCGVPDRSGEEPRPSN
jgi:hypothetical protein